MRWKFGGNGRVGAPEVFFFRCFYPLPASVLRDCNKLMTVFKVSLCLFCLSPVLAELPEEKEFYKLLGLCLTVNIPLPFLRILDRVWSNGQALHSSITYRRLCRICSSRLTLPEPQIKGFPVPPRSHLLCRGRKKSPSPQTRGGKKKR